MIFAIIQHPKQDSRVYASPPPSTPPPIFSWSYLPGFLNTSCFLCSHASNYKTCLQSISLKWKINLANIMRLNFQSKVANGFKFFMKCLFCRFWPYMKELLHQNQNVFFKGSQLAKMKKEVLYVPAIRFIG